MHYLFEIVEQHYPDCQLFIDDLFHVEAASRVSPDLLQKSLRQMESNIKGLEMDLKNCNQSDPDDRFIEVLGVSLMSILFHVYSHLRLCFLLKNYFYGLLIHVKHMWLIRYISISKSFELG
jgi:hypothetical protein